MNVVPSVQRGDAVEMLAWGLRVHVGGENRKPIVSKVNESTHTLCLITACLHLLRCCKSSILEVSGRNSAKGMLLSQMEGALGKGGKKKKEKVLI